MRRFGNSKNEKSRKSVEKTWQYTTVKRFHNFREKIDLHFNFFKFVKLINCFSKNESLSSHFCIIHDKIHGDIFYSFLSFFSNFNCFSNR
jgi:hypothetical protein